MLANSEGCTGSAGKDYVMVVCEIVSQGAKSGYI
jgi:hypothetical protein